VLKKSNDGWGWEEEWGELAGMVVRYRERYPILPRWKPRRGWGIRILWGHEVQLRRFCASRRMTVGAGMAINEKSPGLLRGLFVEVRVV
jgi:hypothetical protein